MTVTVRGRPAPARVIQVILLVKQGAKRKEPVKSQNVRAS